MQNVLILTKLNIVLRKVLDIFALKKLIDLSYFKQDLSAGLVVFLVSLPLSLGIAMASGAPLFAGIIAGVVGGIIVGLISGSKFGVSGPAAGLTIIVLDAISTLDSFECFLLTVIIAGIIQIFFGIFKLGIIGYFFPSSVIKGMLAAIGLLLILKQLPIALGLTDVEKFNLENISNEFLLMLWDIKIAFVNIHLGTTIISILSLMTILLYNHFKSTRYSFLKFLPGALLSVFLGIGVNFIFENYLETFKLSEKHFVLLPVAENLSDFKDFFTKPDFSDILRIDIFVIGTTIAIVASLESLLCAEATDKIDPDKGTTPPNRELIAQGVGNIFSGLLGGLPVTQVIVRTSANIDAGAKTKISTIFHGILLLVSVAFIPKILNKIPLASLAAILIIVGYKLTKVGIYLAMFKIGWSQFLPFAATIIGVLLTDLLLGIGIGIVLAVIFILRANYKIPYFFEVDKNSNHTTIILAQEVSFLNKAGIQMMLSQLNPNSKITIDGSNSIYIDNDVLEILYEFKNFAAKTKNIEVEFKNVPEYKYPKIDSH